MPHSLNYQPLIDFRNVNTLWASVLVETLHRCGVTLAVICPGSRSTPLTVAFANHPQIVTMPILDERSASFFALGRAKRTGVPTVLVCTSGTAGANFYPAIIEAKESNVPLMVLTADRPPELRNCHAGQTIDQIKLYGHYPNWQSQLALPEASLPMLSYLRQTIVHAYHQALFPVAGVVHLNQPFREPLAPIDEPSSELENIERENILTEHFFASICPVTPDPPQTSLPWHRWQDRTGIIIAGLAQPTDPQAYCQAIALLSQQLSYPVFADALSPLRNYAQLNPDLISTYDSILRQPAGAHLVPEVIIQVGELPISKQLRKWLGEIKAERWIIDPRIDNLDPLHQQTIHLPTTITTVTAKIAQSDRNLDKNSASLKFCEQWLKLEAHTRAKIDSTLGSVQELYEGKAAWLISQSLPPNTPIFLANSMSVRYAEYFWQPNQRQIAPFFSRGANGIDGTLSTALGITEGGSGVLLTGDLALLHDTNGFLIGQQFRGHLTIVLINNSGGGIFEILPIANFPSFEKYFATPQKVEIAQLCAAYQVEHIQIHNWQQFVDLISELPTTGIRVLELICDRHRDAKWLKSNLNSFAAS